MSIFTGKDGYNSKQSWTERSDVDRLKRTGKYEYETGLNDGPDPVTAWLRDKIIQLPLASIVYPDRQPDILEVGSGFGGWSEKLAGLYRSFTGAEVMEERVNHARLIRTRPNVRFYHITDPDFYLGRTFDVVLSITVIQHLPMPLAINCLKAISRHMRPDGVAFMSEGRIYDCTVEDAEKIYADQKVAAHMIAKPISLLQDAVPDLIWEREGGIRFILRKRK